MPFTTPLIRRIEDFEGTDRLAKPLQRFASRLVQRRLVRNTLSGTTLGHPLHPMLTDVPVGAWLAAGPLDAIGGDTAGPTADLLVGAGVAAAVPTALSGLNVAGTASVFLHRRGGQLPALANTCSHMGGPLAEGKVEDGCVICSWHGSTFRLDDGSIVRGPASTPQPRYETRVTDGRIEVRARS